MPKVIFLLYLRIRLMKLGLNGGFMRIENMRTFVEVANCGSMTTAANALFTSAQNVSKTICQIENELGVQLLVRSRKGCTLTGEGERFYSVCVPILRQWESYVQPLNPLLPSKIRGTIRIAASLFMVDFIATESRLLQREYPNIKVELVEQLGGASSTKQRVQDTCDIICFACDEENLEAFRQQQRNRLLYLIKKEPLRLFFYKDNPLLKNADVVTNKLLES